MHIRGVLWTTVGPVARRRGLGAVLLVAVVGVLGAPGVAEAEVTFDRAFGLGVDSGAAAFENCTTAGGCQAGINSDAAGGMSDPLGMAVDAEGRILVADDGNHRVERFVVADDGSVSFDRAFGIGVDTGALVFENCTTASGCQTGIHSDIAGGMGMPQGVAVDGQGRILVVDRQQPGRAFRRRGRRHGQLRPRLRDRRRPSDGRPATSRTAPPPARARPAPQAAPPVA